MTASEVNQLIQLALNGNKEALEKLLVDVQDLVFNLSLRMLGTISDAEDTVQEIMIRIMTNLSSFRKESSFSTWVYRIAINYLLNYRKSMFAKYPLTFQYYGDDISAGCIDNSTVDLMGVDENIMAEELKMSCTNVMLQCLDPESRCIFILGTMFKVDSRIASEVLDISADNYRKKLSRIRKKMAGFLSCYCGLTETGSCNCKKRIGYAIKQNRINPKKMEFNELEQLDKGLLLDCKEKMETIDKISIVFSNMPKYKSPKTAKAFIRNLLKSSQMTSIQNLM